MSMRAFRRITGVNSKNAILRVICAFVMCALASRTHLFGLFQRTAHVDFDSCEQGVLTQVKMAPLLSLPPSQTQTARAKHYINALGDVDNNEYYYKREWYIQHTIFPFLVYELSR